MSDREMEYNYVIEQDAKRFKVLKTIYFDTKGHKDKVVDTNYICENTGICGEDLLHILEYLENQILIKPLGSLYAMYGGSAYINITHQGVCEVENAIKTPNKPTLFFPAMIENFSLNIQNNDFNSANISGGVAGRDCTYNSMSDNHSTNIQAGRDASGNLLSSEVTGVFAGGDISGTVNNAINQLQTSNNPEVLQLAELLKKLQTVIEAEPALESDDKDIALQQVAVLADEGQNPKKESGIKPVKTAVAALKGIVGALPPATELVKEFNELLPMILSLLGLG